MMVSLGIFPVSSIELQPVVWVDDDFDDQTPGWGVTHFNNIPSAASMTDYYGTMYIAAGTNYTGGPVSRPITIIGEGKNNVLIGGSSYVFDVSNNPYFSISGCTIQGGTIHNVYGLYDNEDGQIFIRDCIISNSQAPDSGIHIEVEDEDVDVEIAGCKISNNSGNGVTISYSGICSGYVNIVDNEIFGNGTGIELVSGLDVEADDIYLDAVIEGNYVHGNSKFGIYFEHVSQDIVHLDIVSNAIIENGDTGIYVLFSEVIMFPFFLDNGFDDFLSYFSTARIEDNAILRNGTYGIDFDHNIHDFFWWWLIYGEDGIDDELFPTIITLTRNHIYQSDNSGIDITTNYYEEYPDGSFELGDTPPGSILVDEYFPYHITKNFILHSGNDGVHMGNSDNWLIANNLIAYTEGCGGNGITLRDSSCFTMNNTIYDNETNGIQFLSGGSARPGLGQGGMPGGYYINNIIVGNGEYGISFDLATTLGTNGSVLNGMQSNNVWGNDAGNYYPPFFDFTGVHGNISQDPLFASPDDPRLTVGSPCVDAGWDDALYFVRDDIEDVARLQARHIDMGCFELIWSSFSPETFHPLVITQLANANSMWTCLMDNLPDDPELMEEVEPMLEDVQAHMGNATSIANYIQANGELRQTLSIMEEIDAMCECGCFQ
jgi:hypothetical protein